MVQKSNISNFHNYRRTFKWANFLSYLITSFFISYYKTLDILIISRPGLWSSYLSVDSMEKTAAEGLRIYGNKKEYDSYVADFKDHIRTSEEYFKKTINQEEISQKEVKEFFDLAIIAFYYYSKTEFFYTDKAFMEQEYNQAIKENFRDFGRLKIDGRKHLDRIFLEDDSYLARLVKKLSEQFNIEPDDLWAYGQTDVIGLFAGRSLNKETIRGRKTTYVLEVRNGEERSVYGQEAERLVKEFIGHRQGKHKTIKGQIANKGKTRGWAKVLKFGLQDFKLLDEMIASVREGDILVSETTVPEIIMACNKASAIVTDQGGMMSHAAIVARELGIPCIVGTDIATEAIRDGQEIEVDADTDTGIVTLL